MKRAEAVINLSMWLGITKVCNKKEEPGFPELLIQSIKASLFNKEILWAVKEYIEQLEKEVYENISPLGIAIKEKMDSFGIDLPLFCLNMGLTPDAARALLNGEMELTQEMADKLENLLHVNVRNIKAQEFQNNNGVKH